MLALGLGHPALGFGHHGRRCRLTKRCLIRDPGRGHSGVRCRGKDAGEHHLDDALRVRPGERAQAAVDDEACRASDHPAEESAVDRSQIAPVDGEIHPTLRIGSALLEDPGHRLPDRGSPNQLQPAADGIA